MVSLCKRLAGGLLRNRLNLQASAGGTTAEWPGSERLTWGAAQGDGTCLACGHVAAASGQHAHNHMRVLTRAVGRVTGGKARGLHTGETGCRRQTFSLSLLSGRRKQTTASGFSVLYTDLKGFF